MTHDRFALKPRVGLDERTKNPDEACVLRVRVGHLICPLEFDAYGKVITALAAGPPGGTRMPGSAVEGYELDTRACTMDEHMRGDAYAAQRVVLGRAGEVEAIAEQGLDMI